MTSWRKREEASLSKVGFSQWGFQAAGGWLKATIFYHFRKKTSVFLGSLPEAFTTNNLHFAYVPEISQFSVAHAA